MSQGERGKNIAGLQRNKNYVKELSEHMFEYKNDGY